MVASIQAVVVLCLYQLVKSHRVCPRSLSVPPIGREGLVFQAGTVSSGPSCALLVRSVPVVLGLINHGCPIPETLAANTGKRQRYPFTCPLQHTGKIGLDTGAVNERRPDNRYFHAATFPQC